MLSRCRALLYSDCPTGYGSRYDEIKSREREDALSFWRLNGSRGADVPRAALVSSKVTVKSVMYVTDLQRTDGSRCIFCSL
jgi:hypothetical protein